MSAAIDDVAASIAHFVAAMEAAAGMMSRMSSTRGQVSVIAMMRIEMVIHVAMEVGGTVKPWTGADENAARKPLRAVIAIRRAGVGSVTEIPIGTDRSRADVHGDSDLRFGRGRHHEHGEERCEENRITHGENLGTSDSTTENLDWTRRRKRCA